MDPKRWQRIEALFSQALERPAHERAAFLEDACRGDRALFDEVMGLVEADSRGHSLLDGGAVEAMDLAAEFPRDGSVVGRYRLVRRIGAGGMGAVYLAERADGQFEQRVALKFLRWGMESPEALGRFHAERQILAHLEHPNIARLLDGGVTDDGRSYFTMEYVEGQPIDAYCDARRLTVRERLALFEVVCQTVQYAQHNLIVHRDLKPGNILVTEDGTVKLLDFGIAKLLGDDDTVASMTRTGQGPMTPGYAAPEQVRGEAVTTATDVYALGVILYELLTGHRPYDVRATTRGALERAIVETSPERPSTVCTRDAVTLHPGSPTTTTSAEELSLARGTRPEQLRRELAGDLDTICLMALRKEPDRRYGSAEQLLEDLRRYRAGRPIAARPDTVGYRARKFIGRNLAWVTAVAAAVLVVATLVTFYTVQLAGERDRARLEARRAASVSSFLTSIFQVSNPGESRGETITARELLDRGAARIGSELASQPGVQATMYQVIASVYESLGLFDRAQELASKSVALGKTVHGNDDREVLNSMEILGAVLRDRSSYPESEKVLAGALATAKASFAPDDTMIALLTDQLAQTIDEQGHYGEAEPLYRKAISIWKKHGKSHLDDVSVALNNLGVVLHERGEYTDAESTFAEALRIQHKVYGKVHPEIATTLYNLGQLLRAEGDYDEAERVQRKGLALDLRLHGENHPDVAYSMNSLAILLERNGEYAEAESLYDKALAIRRRVYHGDHSNIAYTLAGLARVKQAEGDYAGAESLVTASMKMHERVNGPNHPVIALRLRDLANIAYDTGKFDKAVSLYRLALEREVKQLGRDSPEVATGSGLLARALLAEGKLEEAHTRAEISLARERVLHGDDHPYTGRALETLADVDMAQGRPDSAETCSRRALAIMEKRMGADHIQTAESVNHLAGVLRERGKLDEAERLYRRALAIRTRHLPAGNRRIGETLVGLGKTLCARGDGRSAQPTLRKGIAMLARVLPADHPELKAARAALEHCPPDAGR